MNRAVGKCKITIMELDKCTKENTYRPLGNNYNTNSLTIF